MNFSIRTRLTFWYTSLLFVSLIAFGAAFSYSLLRIFIYRTDNQVSSVANMMVHTIVRPSGELFLPRDFDIFLERFFGIRTAGNYIQVVDPHGQVVAKSSNLDMFRMPLTKGTYHAALGGATTFEVVKNVGRYQVRVVTKPIFVDEKLVAIVQVGSSLGVMNEMIGRLEKSFRQIRQFTGDASHELKTPLTIMKGEIEIALRSKGDAEYFKEVLSSNLEEIDRMSYIVRNLLDLAKMDVEKGETAHETVDLGKVVADRCEQLKRLALDSGVRLDMIENKELFVKGDHVRISQLVFNLIDNAIKYTPAGGRVEVLLKKEGGMAVFKVRDTGIGISADDLPYIFDRFYRVDKARKNVGGAGLGLSICKEIAEAHGGTLSVESVIGRGSVFTVSLPIAAAEEMSAEPVTV